jgi:hypothetical protein
MSDFQRIDPPRLAEHFLRMCPDFKATWDEHLAYWRDQERGDYIDIAEFARFLVDCYAHQKTERFPEIFGEVERLLTQGNAKVRELVSIGLLEDIQTIASHHDFGSEVFVHWLGPTSRQAWYEIAKMWEGKESLMDVVRDELRKEKGT